MKKKKFFISLITLIVFSFLPIFSNAASMEQKTNDLSAKIHSEAVLIMEAETGKVIYEKNGYQVRYPASTTKIMTAILAIENCDLGELATASEFAINSIPYDYSVANIRIGEQMTIKDLLYALMIHSANEAAYVLAEHVGGTNEHFAELMNEKAKEIGCQNTHFVNPNGIQDENHYSSAYDLALITKYAMQNETFREIVKTTEYTLAATESYQQTDRTFTNTNHLIIPSTPQKPNNYYYPYAIGVKTGYTSAAQNCLVSAASKDGIEYICVVLGAIYGYENGAAVSYRYTDSISLFDFAFENYIFKDLTTKNDFVEKIDIPNSEETLETVAGSTISVLLDSDNFNTDYEPKIEIKNDLSLPIKKGDIVGKVVYTIDEDVYYADLIALEDVDAPLLEQLSMQLHDYSTYYVVAGIFLASGILILLVTFVVILVKKKRRKVCSVITKEEIIKTDSDADKKESENKNSLKLADEKINNDVYIDSSKFSNSTDIAEHIEVDLEDELTGELSSDILSEKNKGAKK